MPASKRNHRNEPLVSILIPAFNAERWLPDTLRSAIAQTWEHKEIIVVDDGSADKTLAVARQFESGNFRVVQQENQGAAAARNKAYSLCQGDFIQWLDADDILAPGKLSRQLDKLDRLPSRRSLLVSAWGKFLRRYDRAQFVPTSLWRDLSPRDFLFHKLMDNAFMQTATWLVSRELTDAAGPWDTRLLGDDDGEYFCRVLLASDGTRFVPEARVYYRAHLAPSLSFIGHSPTKIEAHWLSMQLHIKYLRSLENSERTRLACLKYLERGLIYFYAERPDLLREVETLANDLGGALPVPRLSWKYAWIKTLFGWRPAVRMQDWSRKCRWSIQSSFERVLPFSSGPPPPPKKR
jgi:glycosyltransferase involved in cell wall biosynthesis